MKLTTGLQIIRSKNVDKLISKKILLANTSDKSISPKVLSKSVSPSIDPAFMDGRHGIAETQFNPDIRYRNNYHHSPLTQINYRNDLLLFAENNEIKKAVKIMANETAIIDTDTNKYPVYPTINETLIPEEKQGVAKAIQEYLDDIFFPQLWQMYNFKDDGLIDKIQEFKTTGKIAYEIIYDNIKSPRNIIGIIPIDPSALQKVKIGDYIYYVHNDVTHNQANRVLHENQVILIEENKYDFGHVSYVDRLRVPFNIMQSMQRAKALWFAAKSQVRMHVKLALGDVSRVDAIQKLVESKNMYTNKFTFGDDGRILWNNEPNNSGYREFFTAETSASGTPEIDEVNTNGPDLTEVDSLQYWEKYFWKETEIPYDRIDPNASDSWGFTDVSNLRKIEINFAKEINAGRKLLNELFLKPIIIQLTLKEVEIGVDLSLLDSIKMQWIAFNQYEKLAELEILQKKIDIATSLSQFGEQEDSEGNMRKHIPLGWISKNYLDFTTEQYESMEVERRKENILLGFNADGTDKDETETDTDTDTDTDLENKKDEDDANDIINFEDEQY